MCQAKDSPAKLVLPLKETRAYNGGDFNIEFHLNPWKQGCRKSPNRIQACAAE
jgi:hypothetical protein